VEKNNRQGSLCDPVSGVHSIASPKASTDPTWIRRWSTWLLPSAAFAIYLAGKSPFLGQWDSFDYLKEAVTHTLSSLGFGRPVFVGYNIVLWEFCKRAFHLAPLQFETVAALNVIAIGAAGVLLFQRLASLLLWDRASAMAALAFALSPSYALYTGYVMADIPMLVTALASALLLWEDKAEGRSVRDLSAGLLFGISVGMREQAATLFPALLWIVWVQRSERTERVKSAVLFGASSALITVAPIAALYFHDPVAFSRRMRVWLSAIPMGRSYFWQNVQASVLYTLVLCPAAWIALLCAGIYHLSRSRTLWTRIPWTSLVGAGCSLVLPVALLWRDADVQLHPRYVLVALPAAVVVCTHLYSRWLPSSRAAILWAALQVAVFGIAQVATAPFRHLQAERREYAVSVREQLNGKCVLIPGSYSPAFDYYRAIGLRPGWEILWSGWGWKARNAEDTIRSAWSRGLPLYFCDGPAAWLYFEDERLDLYFITRGHPRETVVPGLIRVYP
jgi:hypothetical protein